jgi:hypothetical protein
MADVPVPRFRKYWTNRLAPLEFECYDITNTKSEAVLVAQQVFSNIEDLAR